MRFTKTGMTVDGSECVTSHGRQCRIRHIAIIFGQTLCQTLSPQKTVEISCKSKAAGLAWSGQPPSSFPLYSHTLPLSLSSVLAQHLSLIIFLPLKFCAFALFIFITLCGGCQFIYMNFFNLPLWPSQQDTTGTRPSKGGGQREESGEKKLASVDGTVRRPVRQVN